MLMTVYSTGMRRAEMCQLKVEDIDSDRMLIHIRQGKGRRDRDVPLKEPISCIETLREYWRWMKPTSPRMAVPQRISQRLREQTSRSAAKMVRGEACRDMGATSWHQQARTPAFIAPQFRHTPSGRWRRFAHRAVPLLGHADLKPTSIYLHLSERHLRAAGTPLDNANLSSADQVKRSRRLQKK